MKAKSILFFTLAIAVLSLSAFPAKASLIGQNVDMEHFLKYFPSSTHWGEVFNVVVTDTDTDSVFIFNGRTNEGYDIGYWADINADSIHIRWDFDQTRIYNGNYTSQSINGLHISGFETDLLERMSFSGSETTHFTFSNSNERVFILPEENRMMLDFAGLTVHTDSEIVFNFSFSLASVPEPPVFLLFLIGALFATPFGKMREEK